MRAAKLILGLLMMGETAVAQTPPQADPTPAPVPSTPAAPVPSAAPTPPPPTAAPVETDVTVRQRPSLGLDDMLRQARDYRDRLDMAIQQMNTKAEQIRQQKDII